MGTFTTLIRKTANVKLILTVSFFIQTVPLAEYGLAKKHFLCCDKKVVEKGFKPLVF